MLIYEKKNKINADNFLKCNIVVIKLKELFSKLANKMSNASKTQAK